VGERLTVRAQGLGRRAALVISPIPDPDRAILGEVAGCAVQAQQRTRAVAA